MFKLFGKKKNDFFVEIGDSAAAPAETAPAPAPVEVAPAAVEEVLAEAPAKEAKSKKTSIKEKAAKVAKAAKKDNTAKAEAPPAPVAAPIAAPAPKKPESVVLFAPNYLMPTPTSARRRPGANMNGFLDMAKQYKKR